MKSKNKRLGWPSGFKPKDFEAFSASQQVVDTLRKISSLYGYKQMQTPRTIDISWLKTKNAGGQETNAGIFTLGRLGQKKPSRLALVFEHTLSLAKYLSLQGPDVNYPFRRMEVGPVFRGEKPQRGRKREFDQADIDVVGLTEPWGEMEIISIMAQMLDDLSFPPETKIHLNDRRLLVNLISIIDEVGEPETLKNIMRQIDKLDKKTTVEVIKEADSKDIPKKTIEKIVALTKTTAADDPVKAIEKLSKELKKNNWWNKGIESTLNSMSLIFSLLGKYKNRVSFNPSLARGLDYYTATVFEIRNPKVSYSLCGGGRYDNLIEDIGGPANMPAIGFAFGIDRMVSAAKQLNVSLSPSKKGRVAILAIGQVEPFTLTVAAQIRKTGISAVIVNPNKKNLKDQLKIASDQKFPYCVIIGENEEKNRSVTLKDMIQRKQENISVDQLGSRLRQIILNS